MIDQDPMETAYWDDVLAGARRIVDGLVFFDGWPQIIEFLGVLAEHSRSAPPGSQRAVGEFVVTWTRRCEAKLGLVPTDA